jgi:hypothetical protein
LNVVWAPPRPSTEQNALFQSGVAGHTAGKTTFCRLIRYILGEPTFATEATRRRIRDKLSTAWALGEIVIGNESWVVARPLSIGPHSFCIRGGHISQASDGSHREDYQSFLSAIEVATIAKLPAVRFPSSGSSLLWTHILPWLTRDQECRFADFLEWRHSSSDSDAPSLNIEERQFVARSVLGLISDEERAEQHRNAQLVSQRTKLAQSEPLLLHQARVDHARVSDALGLTLEPFSTPLFGSQARAELEARTARLVELDEKLKSSDRRETIRAALEAAVATETNLRRNLQDTEARLAQERITFEQLSGNSQASLLAALPPPKEYCNVRMTQAREQRCPLAVSLPIELAARRSENSAATELKIQRELVRSLEAAAEVDSHTLKTAEEHTSTARRTFLSESSIIENTSAELHQERARLSHITNLVRETEHAWEEAQRHAATVERLTADINNSYTRQEDLRRNGRTAIMQFSATFDHVVRALLGDEVRARVDTTGRSLSLVVDEHGERDSAAIATVRLLSFDLAALTSSIEGQGNFPCFLIHDGPREADMAPEIFERLFIFARELERCFVGDPSFQYVITTTTRPPSDFLARPWLRITLAGTPAEERFLKCNL